MRKVTKKKILSWLLLVCLILTMIPVTAFAAEEQQEARFNFAGDISAGVVMYRLNNTGDWIDVSTIQPDAGNSRWVQNLQIGNTVSIKVNIPSGKTIDMAQLCVGVRNQEQNLTEAEAAQLLGDGYTYTITDTVDYEIVIRFNDESGNQQPGDPQPGDGEDHNPPAINKGDLTFRVDDGEGGIVYYSVDNEHWDEVKNNTVISANQLAEKNIVYVKYETKEGWMLDNYIDSTDNMSINRIFVNGLPSALSFTDNVASFDYTAENTYQIELRFIESQQPENSDFGFNVNDGNDDGVRQIYYKVNNQDSWATGIDEDGRRHFNIELQENDTLTLKLELKENYTIDAGSIDLQYDNGNNRENVTLNENDKNAIAEGLVSDAGYTFTYKPSEVYMENGELRLQMTLTRHFENNVTLYGYVQVADVNKPDGQGGYEYGEIETTKGNPPVEEFTFNKNTIHFGENGNVSMGGFLSGNEKNVLTLREAFGAKIDKVYVKAGSDSSFGEEHLIQPSNDGLYRVELDPALEYSILIVQGVSDDLTIWWSYLDIDRDTDRYVENGRVYLDKIERNGNVILEDTNADGVYETLNTDEFHTEPPFQNMSISETGGYIQVKRGDNITLRLVPDYGYQIIGARINGSTLSAMESRSTFEIENMQNNLHFAGSFKPSKNTSTYNLSFAVSDNISSVVSSGTLKMTAEAANVNDNIVPEDYEAVGAYDITLENLVSKGDENSYWRSFVTDLKDSTATVSLNVEDLDPNANYSVIREHGDVKETLDAKVSDDGSAITFETDKFSTYTIVKEKVQKEISHVVLSGATLSFDEGTKTNTSIFTGKVPENSEYILKYEMWQDGNGNVYGSDSGINNTEDLITKFNAGTEYKYSIVLQAKEGYYFSDKTILTIGDKTYLGSIIEDAGNTYVYYTNIESFTPDHTYAENWTSDANEHWHECVKCGAKLDAADHIPGAEATETTAQTCTVCGYELQAALGHIHTNHLTAEKATEATATKNGNKAYYTCSCGKWFADENAKEEIIDKSSIVIPAYGEGTKAEIGSGKIETTIQVSTDAPKATVSNLNVGLVENLLTDTQLADIKNGAECQVYLEVKNADLIAPVEDKSKAEALVANMKNTEIGSYFDLSMYMKIGSSAPEKITDTKENAPVITIAIPESLINTNTAVERTFQILRVHEGVAQLLDTKEINGKLIFTTGLFSTYAIVYKDTAKSVHVHTYTKVEGKAATTEAAGWKSYYTCTCGKLFADAEGKSEITDLNAWKLGAGKIDKLASSKNPNKVTNTASTPKTGDDTNIILLFTVLLISFAVLTAAFVYGKRRKMYR